MMTPKFDGKDPLAAARQHLDFEAMAKDAPSAKTILFKAQTIVPMVPVKPWERFGKAGAALAVALLLLFAPLVPSTAQLALVRVQFEDTFTRSEAQQLAFDAAANLPAQLLAAADYAAAPGQSDGGDAGRLTLRLASVRLGPEELADAALDSLEGAGEARPFVTPTTGAKRRSWQSIPNAVASRLTRGDNEISHFPASNSLANDIISNAEMIESALADHMLQSGFELTSFNFAEYDSRVPLERDSFVIPAWPRWARIGVTGYASVPQLQQQEIRSEAAGFLDGLLLSSQGVLLRDTPGPELPVLLTVADRQGSADPVATRLVQAEFGRLVRENPPLGKFETEALVDRAVSSKLEGLDYRISYQQYSMFEPGQGPETFVATITISGKSRHVLREFTMPEVQSEAPAEF